MRGRRVTDQLQVDGAFAQAWYPAAGFVIVAIVANQYLVAPYLGAALGVEAKILAPDLDDRMWDLIVSVLNVMALGKSGEKIARDYMTTKAGTPGETVVAPEAKTAIVNT